MSPRASAGAAAAITVLAAALTGLSGSDDAAGSAPPFETLDEALAPTRALIERYTTDRALLRRYHDTPMSEAVAERERRFHTDWLETIEAMDFETLDVDGRVDWVLFRNLLHYELRTLEHETRRLREIEPFVPFAAPIVAWHEAHRRLETLDPAAVAAELTDLGETIRQTRRSIERRLDDPATATPLHRPTTAYRAARMVDRLRDTLRAWYDFHVGYDPLFTWWVKTPYEAVDPELERYAAFLRERLAGVGADDEDAIIGDPVGREQLLSMLEYEMIPYSPEKLVEIANREYAWCQARLLEASAELGYGDDWKAALDHVKSLHVEPGAQPMLIHDLACEAIDFLKERDLLTIPELCRTSWRMEMMSPERQKVSPYFLGGEVIIVSFPTDGMTHADKLMSMRGNNVHFARATVHHELIPGHHLQGFMVRRHRTHRRVFSTPFWMEGWALYWEMQLWDLGFARSPEDEIGMLFWRTHRCARIIFSLSFHLGTMSPEEAIDFLVENVGHERNNAEAEVRRSVSGEYGPLYQAAYMLGGLQIRSLHAELVSSGRMTDRDFHDAILKQNSIPIELVRAALTGRPPGRDFRTSWRFAD